ncbi:S41 family peptidase [Pseudoalteromonas sp. NJ631]|uniref:S41 family peptidase n=1 Tax=Pseudoalteromonas sp. NJ631 TaxID=493915 RepID=UPI000A064A03|nr:S41 family peptidase [Pseudoalteromonas sp. NJ631]
MMKKFNLRPITLILCIGLAGCHFGENKSSVEVVQQTLRNELWYSEHYGEIKQIVDERLVTWQVTGSSCYPILTLDPLPLFDAFSAKSAGLLTYKRPYDSGPVKYTEISSLDEVCKDGFISTSDKSGYTFDAEAIFELFWLDMKNHYAFFSERNVDWDAVYNQYAGQLSDANETRLLGVFREILELLNDGHTRLYFSLEEEPINFEAKPTLFKRLEREAVALNLTGELAEKYIETQTNQLQMTIAQYLDQETKQDFIMRKQQSPNGPNWGVINTGGQYIGYLKLYHFENFIDVAGIERQDISYANAAFNDLLDEIFTDLSRTNQLIIDIRDNEGGYDIQALELITRFISQNTLVWDISTFYDGALHQLTSVYAEPDNERPYYLKDIYLLTSNGTFSAGETFALAMSALPQVTLVGRATAGATSDTFPRMLPNGWIYELSNEYYENSLDLNVEVLGVPVDVEVDPFDITFRKENKDAAIEKVLSLLSYEP